MLDHHLCLSHGDLLLPSPHVCVLDILRLTYPSPMGPVREGLPEEFWETAVAFFFRSWNREKEGV